MASPRAGGGGKDLGLPAMAPPRFTSLFALCLRSRTVWYERSFAFGRGASAATLPTKGGTKGGTGGSPRSLSCSTALG
eukprot:2161264-Alexandrium_andersonii.AAC.1